MIPEPIDAGQLVADTMAYCWPSERADVLRSIMAHAAAALVALTDTAKTAESVYRLADAIATQETPE